MGVHMAPPFGPVPTTHPAVGTCRTAQCRCTGACAAAVLPHVLWGVGCVQLRERQVLRHAAISGVWEGGWHGQQFSLTVGIPWKAGG
jgi:hypothetical protein